MPAPYRAVILPGQCKSFCAIGRLNCPKTVIWGDADMKTIITIQHTQSTHHTNGMVGSWTDWELTELGVNQAKRIGEKLKAELKGREFVMYSSDLLSAKQTAEIVGELLGLSPILRTELREKSWKMLWEIGSMAS